MTPTNIEVILQTAFDACEARGQPLSTLQREILFRVLVDRIAEQVELPSEASGESSMPNPLDELTLEQRQAVLRFIQEQTRQQQSWKAQLLNDWLHDRDSGTMQFVRNRYGLQWLERVQAEHIAQYANDVATALKAGDRIEITNGLWEWVQEEGPCSREWFPCTVVAIQEASMPPNASGYTRQTNCLIRFDNGMEYEIQGVYEWNRYNWRWLGTESA